MSSTLPPGVRESVALVSAAAILASLFGTGLALRFLGSKERSATHHPPSVRDLDRALLRYEGRDDEHAMKELVRKCVVAHKDFPRKGVLFQDFLPVFQSHEATRALVTLMFRHLRSTHGKIDVIVGLEARGFLLGPMLAMFLDASFVPVRKVGKLPGPTERTSYKKEYGSDELEIQKGSIKPNDRVVIVDDLLATGGSVAATAELITKLGAVVTEAAVVIELVALKGRDKCKTFPVWTLFEM